MKREDAMDKTTTVDDLKTLVEEFVRKRAWEQFHTPKNLSMGLAIEAAELMELFQWYSGPDSIRVAQRRRTKRAAAEELADCVIYCLSFATATGIDIAAAVRAKLRRNQRKYPVRKFRGRF
jgi:NTP pyrophosphatase (non-canonical NTP hydrolase)